VDRTTRTAPPTPPTTDEILSTLAAHVTDADAAVRIKLHAACGYLDQATCRTVAGYAARRQAVLAADFSWRHERRLANVRALYAADSGESVADEDAYVLAIAFIDHLAEGVDDADFEGYLCGVLGFDPADAAK
jgi:hypothetical protein